MRLILALLVAALPALADDLDELLAGVEDIGAPGVPGPLCVFGPKAFPVAAGGVGGKLHAPVVAAARWGEGRVVAFGHGGYLHQGALEQHDTARLVRNAVAWLGGERVAFHRLPAMQELLGARKLDGWQRLAEYDVVCVDCHHVRSDEARAALAAFVRGGGGLLTAGLGWGWLQLNPGKALPTDHPGNRLLAGAGILWADGYLKHTRKGGYVVSRATLAGTHAGLALQAPKTPQAIWTLTQAARTLPPEDTVLRPALRRLRDEHRAAAVPPLTLKQPLPRLALTLELTDLARRAPDSLEAHPAAADFPGAVPDAAPRVTKQLRIDTSVPGWHSTGLYAAPGETIEIDVPAAAAGKGLWLRIGAHNDRLWHKPRWQRCPEIVRRDRIDRPTTKSACAFGGLVYVEVPGRCRLGRIHVTLRGAVAAPHYVHGKTTPAAWEAIRLHPAPWAELETRKVILTVPADAVRKLDDPVALMDFWDGVLDHCADLAARPRERRRPERYVADKQISAGYMHSGYPIMTHLDAAARMTDLARMQKGDWGMFHEMGHNHQHGDWTFGGTGEVTCNLFTLYVYEKMCGIPVAQQDRFQGDKRARMLRQYEAGGRDFDHWKAKPFLALLMYIQLQEAFGWEPFVSVFEEYRGLARAERPKSDAEKRDQWMVRFSRTVNRNLGPFFEAWNVPTSEEARASVADLPPWMPPTPPAGR